MIGPKIRRARAPPIAAIVVRFKSSATIRLTAAAPSRPTLARHPRSRPRTGWDQSARGNRDTGLARCLAVNATVPKPSKPTNAGTALALTWLQAATRGGRRRDTHITIKRTIAWPAKCRKAQPPRDEVRIHTRHRAPAFTRPVSRDLRDRDRICPDPGPTSSDPSMDGPPAQFAVPASPVQGRRGKRTRRRCAQRLAKGDVKVVREPAAAIFRLDRQTVVGGTPKRSRFV